MDNNSPHILSTSANLLGLCFVVLTSIRILKLQQETWIDDLTVIAIFFFMSSCLLSFLSIRKSSKRADFYEKVAEYIFLFGLLTLFVSTLAIAFQTVK